MKWRHVRLRRYRIEGEMLPRWHGVAYHDYQADREICYPIPFNFVVRAWHHFTYWWTMVMKIGKWMPDPMAWAYARGKSDGKGELAVEALIRLHKGPGKEIPSDRELSPPIVTPVREIDDDTS